MSEIIVVGKIMSIVCILFVYINVWGWAIDHAKDCNRNSKIEVVVSKVWISIHIIAAVLFFVWCWSR